MPELNQLVQLLAIARCGTLSAAAEQLHLSQPALSRSMQKLEDELGFALFDHGKNKITLNATGEMAVSLARQVVDSMQGFVDRLQTFDRSRHTIAIGSCAPAPLWDLVPRANRLYPELAVSSELNGNPVLVNGLLHGQYQLAVLPQPPREEGVHSFLLGTERLFLSLPPDHPLAGARELTFNEIDGQSILLLTGIGFWMETCRQKLPHSHLLIQQQAEDYNALIRVADLPFFVTDLALQRATLQEDRAAVPLTDPEARATYYLAYTAAGAARCRRLIEELRNEHEASPTDTL